MVYKILGAAVALFALVSTSAAQQTYSQPGTRTYVSQPQAAQTVYYQTADGKLVTYPTFPATTASHTTYHSGSAGTVQTASASSPVSYSNSAAEMMLARNNAHRASRGMSGHRLSSSLTAAAQSHANYMARTGSFSHYVNGSPQSRAATYGFGGGVRENIAMGQSTVTSAFSSWITSSGHYANLMSSTNAAGFGYAVSSSGQMYWVAMYGNE